MPDLPIMFEKITLDSGNSVLMKFLSKRVYLE